MHSAERQVAAMHRDWPTLRLTGRAGGRLTWRGPLRPLGVEYRVQIVAQAPRRRLPDGRPPRITVLSPALVRRLDTPDMSIPHVYKNEEEPASPLLCLYDPQNGEWGHGHLLAETIVPWIIDWLVCYEIWHATGEWVGGGRHPDPKPAPDNPSPPNGPKAPL